MTKESKNIYKYALGIDIPKTPVQTVSSVIGGMLGIGGLIGALNENNQQKTFLQNTSAIQNSVRQVGSDFGVQAGQAEAQLGADLASHEAGTEAQARQGLVNRGITGPQYGNQSAGQLKAGTSGAYAMAASALSEAKLNAGRAVSGALSSYHQDIAQKQLESMFSQYYGKLGIWKSLGGMGASMLETDSLRPKETTPQADVEDYIPTMEEMTTPFRMKGVKDLTPEYVPGSGMPPYRLGGK